MQVQFQTYKINEETFEAGLRYSDKHLIRVEENHHKGNVEGITF